MLPILHDPNPELREISDPFDLTFKNEKGESALVIMGCYGIGLGRLMGAVAEVTADEEGLSWPKELAPFHYHMLYLGGNADTKKLITNG